MTKLLGQAFKNSDTCEGVAFTPDAPLDLAEIAIRGRYPERGWAMNRECHEVVRVLRGAGSIALRGEEVVKITEGEVVHVPPQTWFAWGGDMTIAMTCSPPFNPEQYEVEEASSEI